ncbi:MAG TPA: hypothetical protein VFL99_17775 [Segeticoccus sp.]|uniref:hypothetical protein n=1 Tax=Segeticoccus sp. TaxID=2706531 RepID=UPI002D7ED69C|nr:hypothetical protein [Segeticoccus sp.]HET8602177.1 hypothetical protein [Segeticoccus sp.]
MEATALDAAYQDLLDTAEAVAGAGARGPAPGQWNAEQILAHVTLVNAATVAAVCSVSSGAITTYDNRIAQDTWTIGRVVSRLGGHHGLCARIRQQASALRALTEGLTEAELDTRLPALLLSNDALLVDDRLPLEALLDGLVSAELPGHTRQLAALRTDGAEPPTKGEVSASRRP